MEKRVEKLAVLTKKLRENVYSFEWDTEDVVFGFKATNRLRTRNMAKALSIEVKLRNDLGSFISPSVRITAIRMYKNGALRGERTIKDICNSEF